MNCQEVTLCEETQSYNYLTNTCNEIITDSNKFPSNNFTQKTNNLANYTVTIPTIKCLNGVSFSNNTICVCYKGWTDDNNSNKENGII